MAHLIIDNEEIYEIARKLADQHQSNIDEIVADALREKFERERAVSHPVQHDNAQLSPAELVARWQKITEELQDEWQEPWKSIDHGELLYDEDGLPK